MQDFNKALGNVVGDVFVAAACVAYYGAFTSVYRTELIEQWTTRCAELEVPCSGEFSLVKVTCILVSRLFECRHLISIIFGNSWEIRSSTCFLANKDNS